MITQLIIPTKKNQYYPVLMRKGFLSVLTIALLVFNLFIDILIPGASSRVFASSINPSNIIALTNSERTNQGLSTLKTDARLSAAAQAKAQDMLSKDYWDHFGPNGESPWQFISGAGYGYVFAGENLAKGFVTAEGVHQAWMASPTHRANIINENYKDIGVATVEGTLQGESVVLVVQMFGSTTVSAPAPAPAPTPVAPVADTVPELPSQPDPAPEIETPLPDSEAGQIKSISIVRPTDGEVITDPSIDVEGTVDGYVGSLGQYTVTLRRGDDIVGTSESSSSSWSIDKGSDWSEGEQSVVAVLEDVEGGDTGITDELKFIIDSKAPTLVGGRIAVKIDNNHAEVRVYTDDPSAEVFLTVGSETYGFAKDSDGSYMAYLPRSVVDNVDQDGQVLILSDQYGNTTESEVSGDMLLGVGSVLPVSTTSFFDSMISNLTTMSLKGKVNLGVAIFLLLLLLVQVFYYKKHRMSNQHGNYLLTMALFVFLVMVGTLVELSGVIN